MIERSIEEEARFIDIQEEWSQKTAKDISRIFKKMDYDVALNSSRWAAIWLEEFHSELGQNNQMTEADVKRLTEETKASTLERCMNVERDSEDNPTLYADIAAEVAFMKGLELTDEGRLFTKPYTKFTRFFRWFIS